MVIDVSHHNGIIDWGKAAPLVEGVMIKITDGTTGIDPMSKVNGESVCSQGRPFSYYHFAEMNSSDPSDPIAQATHLAKVLDTYPTPKGLPVALDVETNPGKLNQRQVEAWITLFFSTLENLGYADHMIYSYSSFLATNLPIDHALGSTKLWLAGYVSEDKLALPHGWDSYFMWQYSESESVDGIIGNVDASKMAS
jgi:GH25 family lysozyme M1 (1,4-beta-N-acetylmuramidase)